MNLNDASLLLTRPRPAALRFVAQVEEKIGHFATCLQSPLLRIVPLRMDRPPEVDEEILFSSENAVEVLCASQPADGRRAWCVGARTASRAAEAGFCVLATARTARDLSNELVRARPTAPLVHVAGRHRRGDLAGTLLQSGLTARTAIAYDQVPEPLSVDAISLLQGTGDVVAPVFSPRTAHLLRQAAEGRRARLHVVAISEAASVLPPRAGEIRRIASTPDADGVLRAMGSLFDADRHA